MTLQPNQPLLCIFHFREAGIGVFPEGEENKSTLRESGRLSE